jgi:hypothetical protein
LAAPYPGTFLYKQALEKGWLDDANGDLVNEGGMAKEFGAPAVRAPLEPQSILARIEGARSELASSALAPLARIQRASRAGRRRRA